MLPNRISGGASEPLILLTDTEKVSFLACVRACVYMGVHVCICVLVRRYVLMAFEGKEICFVFLCAEGCMCVRACVHVGTAHNCVRGSYNMQINGQLYWIR